MITLNLLSPQKKKGAEEKILYATIKNVLAVFLIFFVFIAVILLGSKLLLAHSFETVVEQTTLITKEYGGVNQQIRQINDKLENISNTQKEFVAWSSHLAELNDLIPENIQISVIVLRLGEGNTVVKGYAKTRNDLLLLKSNLENSALFEQVKLPFSNLLKRNDIDFEFQLTLQSL
ncbi:MAG: PilN domain-containing protein [Patescibacteria group bacterium]|nr:PilN domain-containing protein [Patescibacteria group bacterium]